MIFSYHYDVRAGQLQLDVGNNHVLVDENELDRMLYAYEQGVKAREMQVLVTRDPRWERESRLWLGDKTCAACGGKTFMQVHHLLPFHLYPDKEMDPEYWLPLCERASRNCHLRFGHNFNWKSFNPKCVVDCMNELARLK